MGCQETGDREAEAIFCKRHEQLREPSRDVGNLKSAGHGALAQLKTASAVVEYIFIAALELGLSSRNLRDVSNLERDVSLLRTNRLLGRTVERFGREVLECFEYALTFCTMGLAPFTSPACFDLHS